MLSRQLTKNSPCEATDESIGENVSTIGGCPLLSKYYFTRPISQIFKAVRNIQNERKKY